MNGDVTAQLISAAYETVGDVARWPGAIDDFRRALKADAAVQFSSEARSGVVERTRAVSRRTIIGIDEAAADLHARHAPASPIAHIVPKLATGTIHAVYDLLPKAEFDRSFFYDHCVRPTQMTDALFGGLSPLGATMATLNFMRAGSFEMPADREREGLDAVMRHYARAYQLNLRLAVIGLDPGEALSATLNAVAVALLCIGSGGECLWSNERGERLLALGDGIMLDRDRQLCATTGRSAIVLQQLLDNVRLGVPGACTIDRPSGHLPFSIVTTPYGGTRGNDARLILGITSAPVGILAIHELEPPSDLAIVTELELRLAAMFALTSGEARVAVAIYQMPGLRAVAEHLGISRATVQTHLGRVFGKMGIATQSELARRVQSLLVT